MVYFIRQEILIASSPGTISLPLTFANSIAAKASITPINDGKGPSVFVIEGEHVLSGTVQILPGSDAKKGMELTFYYRANLITDVASLKSFVLFGYEFSDEEATKDAVLTCYYNGSTWEVKYHPDFEENEIVEGRHLIDLTITESKLGPKSVTESKIGDASIPERAFQDQTLPSNAFKDQSIPNTAIQDKSIGRQKIGDHQVNNDIIGLMPPGTVKVGDFDWKPVDEQMNDPGEGAILIAQGYGKRPEARLMSNQGYLGKAGDFHLFPSAVLQENMSTYAITPDKADDTMVSDSFQRLVNFSSTGSNKMKTPFKGQAWAAFFNVDEAIGGGDGVITVKNDDDTVVLEVTISNGTVVDTTFNEAIGANGEFEKFDMWKFETSGATSGKVHIDLFVVRRP